MCSTITGCGKRSKAWQNEELKKLVEEKETLPEISNKWRVKHLKCKVLNKNVKRMIFIKGKQIKIFGEKVINQRRTSNHSGRILLKVGKRYV